MNVNPRDIKFKSKIVCDIDETIAWSPEDRDYTKSKPLLNRIAKMNRLFDEGHEIIYHTSRGTKTGGNWFWVTLNQLQEWGCRFHELRMWKPPVDTFIDDKNVNADEFFKDVE